jgi:four helix bundle protein
MRDFRTLKVWHKAAALTDVTYLLIAKYPECERFALVDQTRRAAQSIELNIVEACGKSSEGDFSRFLGYSMGSASELEGCLDIGRRQNFGPNDLRSKAFDLVIEVKKMLAGFLRKMPPPHRRR